MRPTGRERGGACAPVKPPSPTEPPGDCGATIVSGDVDGGHPARKRATAGAGGLDVQEAQNFTSPVIRCSTTSGNKECGSRRNQLRMRSHCHCFGAWSTISLLRCTLLGDDGVISPRPVLPHLADGPESRRALAVCELPI